MRTEGEPLITIDSLSQQRGKLQQVIKKREVLYEHVGTGNVDPIYSAENAIKVGRIKERIQQNIQTEKSRLSDIDDQILDIQAKDFIEERVKRQDNLNQIHYFAKQGHLTPEVVAHYEEEYKSFVESANLTPGLMERAKQIEEEREQPDIEDPDNAKKVYQRMGNFLDGLPDRKYGEKVITTTSRKWKIAWLSDYDEFGDESLYSIFPKELCKNTMFITSTLFSLRRRSHSEDVEIHTKSGLLEATDDELSNKRNIGVKTLNLIHLMQDVVRVERSIEPENLDYQL